MAYLNRTFSLPRFCLPCCYIFQNNAARINGNVVNKIKSKLKFKNLHPVSFAVILLATLAVINRGESRIAFVLLEILIIFDRVS